MREKSLMGFYIHGVVGQSHNSEGIWIVQNAIVQWSV